MGKNQVPELLAPAGSWETFIVALAAGADAIYISGKKFGARYFAENFEKEDIEKIIQIAHINRVKIYVTVNTLIKDSEILEVLEFVHWLYQIGVDGVIIQDLGLANLLRDIIPSLNLHASTQMTIHNLEGVRWANEFGFKRVILSRETEYRELKHIISNIKPREIELEIFVHGALCYGYSGQCLLSSAIGGRSGNRGRCAQPCRKIYHLSHGKKDDYGRPLELERINMEDEYLLSTRDLCLYPELDKISLLSLSSLKIEGRMRSPAYVATVTSVYRNALDSIRKNRWVYNQRDMDKLKVVFNRGFTSGYLLEKNPENIMGREYPRNPGLYVGEIKGYDKKTRRAVITIESDIKLEKGDGLVVIPPKSSHTPSWGFILDKKPIIKKNKLQLTMKKPVNSGYKIYKNKELSEVSIKSYQDNTLYFNKIPLNIRIEWDKDNHPLIDGELKINNKVYNIRFKSDYKMDRAINNPLSEDRIVKQLLKTGNTPFKIDNIKIYYPGGLFTPIGELNKFRREFLDKVKEFVLDSYKPTSSELKEAEMRLSSFKKNYNLNKPGLAENPEYNSYIGIYISDLSGLQSAIRNGIKRVYFEPNRRKANLKKITDFSDRNFSSLEEILLDAFKICTDAQVDLVWKWPSITTPGFLKQYPSLIKRLREAGLEEVMINNLGDIWSLEHSPYPLKLSGSAGLNVFNYQSLKYLSNHLNRVTLSPELSSAEILNILNYNHLSLAKPFIELMVQGNLDVLVTKNSLLEAGRIDYSKYSEDFLGLIDSNDRVFPINIDYEGFNHILNSVELSLIDYIPLLARAGLNGFIIDARNRPDKYIKRMVKIYLKAHEYLKDGEKDMEGKLEKLKLKIKKISLGGITTGNFIKGLKEE